MTEKYLLDANIFINAENYNYPHEIFPGIWQLFELFAKQQIFFSIDKVYDELLKGHDFVNEWAKKNRNMFVDSGTNGISYFNEMSKKLDEYNCPPKHRQSFFSTIADPFIISYAKAKGCTVVTNVWLQRHLIAISN